MELLTRKEAIEYLRISERTMCQLTAAHEIAYIQYRRNGSIFFKPEDLDDYINRKRVATLDERAAVTVLPGGGTLRKRRRA